MTQDLLPIPSCQLGRADIDRLPVVARAGEKTAWRFLEFFTANIRNKNTRAAYAQACSRSFDWCDERGLQLEQLQPVIVASYIEGLQNPLAAPSVKQHLAAIRMLFYWLILGQVVPMNPAAAVRGPKHVVKRGKTPVLKADEARQLLDSMKTDTVVGLRDRALLGLIVLHPRPRGRRGAHACRGLLPERQPLVVPTAREGRQAPRSVGAHHNAEAYMDAYLDDAGIRDEKKDRYSAAWTNSAG